MYVRYLYAVRVFANAESLFYYAKEGRRSKKTLTQQEIQALLAQVTMTTKVTASEESNDEGNKDDVCEVDKDALSSNDQLEFLNSSLEESSISLSSDTDSSHLTTPLSTSHEDFPLTPHSGGDFPLPPHSGGYFPLTPPSGDVCATPHSGGDFPLTPHSGDVYATPSPSSPPEESVSDPYTAPLEALPSLFTLQKLVIVKRSISSSSSHTHTHTHNTVNYTLHAHTHSTVNYPHPLHEAVAIGRSPGVIRELVMMFGANKEDEFKRTPLMFAALGNKRSSISTLIECRADVNRQDSSGLTALHVACYHGNKTAVLVLLSKGASVDILDAKVSGC